MRIAVLADTHDKLPAFISGLLADADEIWHLGDVCEAETLAPLEKLAKPLHIVRGNCDSSPDWPHSLHFEREGFQIFLVHVPPRVAPPGMDLLLHGHTHVPRNEQIGECRFLNPGCVTRPNRGAPPSFGWLELRHREPILWRLESLR